MAFITFILVKILKQKSGNYVAILSCLVPIIVSQYELFNQDTIFGFMGMVTKCVSYAFCIQDGYIYHSQQQNKDFKDENFKKTQVYKYRIQNMINPNDKDDRSFLRFLGFMLFFPNISCSPWIPYADYRVVVQGNYKKNTLSHKLQTIFMGIKEYFKGLLLMYFIYRILTEFAQINPIELLLFGDFKNLSMIIKILWIQFHGTLKRFIFYTSAFLESSSVITVGADYDDQTQKFNKNKQFDIIKMELEWDIGVQAGQYWNKQTHNFLFYNIYTRMFSYQEIKKSFWKKTISQLITYNLQGVQHGTEAGFILFNTLGSLMAFISRALRSAFKNQNSKKNKFFIVIRWMVFSSWLNSLIFMFCIVDYENNVIFAESINYIPYYVTFFGTLWMIFYYLYAKNIKKQILKQEKEKKL